MKHKQIRQGSFETNSSSTHAYTICNNPKAVAKYKPIWDGSKIPVYGYAKTTEEWDDKAAMLAGYLYIENRTEDLEKLKKNLSVFIGQDVEFDFERLLKYSPLSLEDFFCNFTDSYEYGYGNTIDDIKGILDSVLSAPENFVFSNGWIECESYYDG